MRTRDLYSVYRVNPRKNRLPPDEKLRIDLRTRPFSNDTIAKIFVEVE